jgi:hypothetical protein
MPVPQMIRRIGFALGTGIISFAVSQLASESTLWPVTLGVFLGGVVLVVQFLVEFETSLKQISHAAEVVDSIQRSAIGAELLDLTQSAARIGSDTPELVCGLVKSEMAHLATLLEGLRSGSAQCVGEDRDWLLSLTRNATAEICATSTTDVDGGRRDFSDGFWTSELGRSYLEAQQEASGRGVQVRRIFVLKRDAVLSNPSFVTLCQNHQAVGVDVRVISIPEIPARWRRFHDFILFDQKISYEILLPTRTSSGPRPEIEATLLRLDRPLLTERREEFEGIWAAAHSVG